MRSLLCILGSHRWSYLKLRVPINKDNDFKTTFVKKCSCGRIMKIKNGEYFEKTLDERKSQVLQVRPEYLPTNPIVVEV